MQQTDKYQLNLIERDDVFSPDALNESTQKVESALAAEETARKAADAYLTGRADGLDARVTALEVHKIVAGSYVGDSQCARFIDLGFDPIAVIVQKFIPGNAGLAVTGDPLLSGTDPDISVVEGGFTLGNATRSSSAYNNVNIRYRFIAFA